MPNDDIWGIKKPQNISFGKINLCKKYVDFNALARYFASLANLCYNRYVITSIIKHEMKLLIHS